MKGRNFAAMVVSLCLVLVLVLPSAVGCGGARGPQIILGAPLPLNFPDGICARDNLQLAIDDINAHGGVTVDGVTYNFTLVVRDTRDLEPGVSAQQALACIDDLVLNKGASFIVGGPIHSNIALSAMDEIYNLVTQGHPTVAIWSAGFLSAQFGPKVAGNYDKYKYCFRTQGDSITLANEETTILQLIATTHNWTNPKAYIVYQAGVDYAVDGATQVKNNLLALGWNVTGFVGFTAPVGPGMSDLLAANATGAQILSLFFDMPQSSSVITTWYDLELPMLPIGFIVPGHDSLAMVTLGGKCRYVVDVYPRAGITPFNTPAGDYMTLYGLKSLYGNVPGLTWVAPTSYELPYILKDALVRANSLNASDVITALEATNMTGVYGRIAFNTTTHDIIYSTDPIVGAITTWYQWQGTNSTNGQRVPIYPAAVGNTSSILLPPWMP